MKLIILYLVLSTFLSGCLTRDGKSSLVGEKVSQNSKIISKSGRFSLMTFNVENLFDTKHDSGKIDYTFLPLSKKKSKKHIKGCQKIKRKKWRDQCLYLDWSESVLKEKLERISKAIKQVGQGQGPDIIVFQEVENIKVLNRLKNKYLEGLGYKEPVLVEGSDIRGIDIAFLSKFEGVGKPILHKIPFKGMGKKRRDDTRGILQQAFRLPNGEVFTGFGVHFPAPYHPHEFRIQAYKYLKLLKENLQEGSYSFAAGDFNTPKKEEKRNKIFDKYVKSDWVVTHEEGCKSCKGTNYYPPKKSWSFLDMILLSSNFEKPASTLKLKKVFIANDSEEQKDSRGYPNAFRIKKGKLYGLSDHWPVVVEIEY